MWWTQLMAVVRKELWQTARDKRVMFLLIAAPLLQLVVFGYAIDLEVDQVTTVVVDADRTPDSEEHVRRLLADGTLREIAREPDVATAEAMLDDGSAHAAVVVPHGFERDLARGRTADVQVLVDGSDPNRSVVASAAVIRYFGEEARETAEARAARYTQATGQQVHIPEVRFSPRLLYNPGLDTPVYMVPGVAAILLMLITTIVTAMGLARERETGTLEQVLVTPIRPVVLIIGKMLPFAIFGLLDFFLAITVGSWLFDMPIRGNLLALTAITILYLVANLGTGLLISTMSSSQQQAFIAGFLFMLPAALLSGIMTPIHAMPEWLQLATWANPVRHYAALLRAVLLQGALPTERWPELLALTLYGIASVTLAVRRFRKTSL